MLKVVHLIKKTAGPELGPLGSCPRSLPAPPSPAPSREEDRQKLARITKGILTCQGALGCHFTLLSLSFFIYVTGIKTPFPQS